MLEDEDLRWCWFGRCSLLYFCLALSNFWFCGLSPSVPCFLFLLSLVFSLVFLFFLFSQFVIFFSPLCLFLGVCVFCSQSYALPGSLCLVLLCYSSVCLFVLSPSPLYVAFSLAFITRKCQAFMHRGGEG